ncbi:hypothetical protein ABID21_002186 [Pseudorhizobium tarimense]|uniref:Uncharacterized protein n=1 Tax=Pseudorhizobium tarimense TaxID=1079109 RepID=A0ABV2H697_9HYPH
MIVRVDVGFFSLSSVDEAVEHRFFAYRRGKRSDLAAKADPDAKSEFSNFRPAYSVNLQSHQGRPVKVAQSTSLSALFHKYGCILSEAGSHRNNVAAFISELCDILLGETFETFSQEKVDRLATLSRFPRKAYKRAT